MTPETMAAGTTRMMREEHGEPVESTGRHGHVHRIVRIRSRANGG